MGQSWLLYLYIWLAWLASHPTIIPPHLFINPSLSYLLLLLISEISVHAYSSAHSKSNGFCPKEINSNTFLIDPMYSKGIKSYPVFFQSLRALELGHLNAWTLKYLYIFIYYIYTHRLDVFYKDGSPIVYVIETPLDILLVCFHPWMVNWWSLIHRPVPL